jgi:hypothetical protein
MQNWIKELQTASGIVRTIHLSLGSHLCLFDYFWGFRVKNEKVDIPKKESIKELGGPSLPCIIVIGWKL